MPETRRRLLGFDSRLSEEDNKQHPWQRQIREEFLLRPEIEHPLSVDPRIWPSHFHFYSGNLTPSGLTSSAQIIADRDCNGGLWLSLSRMRRRLAQHGRQAVAVAVELCAPRVESLTVDEFPSSLIYSRPEPDHVPEGSAFLGYDVADVGFWSGLSNCAYSHEQLATLRPEWAGRINDYGLLGKQGDALAFRDLTDPRVPEHAPFWVYALHRVSSTETR